MPQERDFDDRMLQMSLFEQLDELRTRIIRALLGMAASYALCVAFCEPLWRWMLAPLYDAAARTGAKVVALTTGEQFQILYMWMPLVASLFLAAPWVLYQVWAFISPGLYRRERRWAAPFLLTTAALFLAGGVFAYSVVLRYSLVFLVGIGRNLEMERFVSISSYFDTFVNVTLGSAVAFELPVVVFFLTLLHITTPSFLMRNARYAVISIAILAAGLSPSTNAFDMAVLFVPMLLLYFLGVFASYVLVLRREDQPFPWRVFLLWAGLAALVGGGAALYWRLFTK